MMGWNGLEVGATLVAAAFGAHWVLVRVVPPLVGGLYLVAAAGLGLAAGAWRWLTGSLDLEEEELGTAITRQVKSEKPCDGQHDAWPRKQREIEVDLSDDLETIKKQIESALS